MYVKIFQKNIQVQIFFHVYLFFWHWYGCQKFSAKQVKEIMPNSNILQYKYIWNWIFCGKYY